jgi:hypothetical protein
LQDSVDFSWNLRGLRANNVLINSGWTSFDIYSEDDCGDSNAIAMIDGYPAVVSVNNSGTIMANVYYFLSGNADGSGGWYDPEYVLNGAGDQIDTVDMVETSENRPLIVCDKIDGIDTQLIMNLGNSVAGDSWLQIKGYDTQAVSYLSLLSMDAGDILMLASHYGTPSALRSAVGAPDASTWTSDLSDLTPGPDPVGGPSDLALISKKATAVFQSRTGGDLMYMEALNDQASDWTEPYPIWTPGFTGGLCQIANVNGAAVVVFYDETTSDLWSAWYEY